MKQVGSGCQKTAVIAVIVGMGACLSWAGNGTWTNTVSGGLWSISDNWSGGAVADGSGFTADFSTLNLTGNNTVRLDGPRTLTTLKFAAGSGTFDWTLDNNGNAANILTLAGTTPTLTVTNRTATLSAVIDGSAGLTKTGAGTLRLSGTNTYSGLTTVNAGVLVAANNSTLGTTNNGTTVSAGAELHIDGSAGDLTIQEPITLNYTSGAIRNIAGNNTMTGLITLNNGTDFRRNAGTLTLAGGMTSVNKGVSLNGVHIVKDIPITLGSAVITVTSGPTDFNIAGNDWNTLRLNFGGTAKLGVDNALPTDAGIEFGWYDPGQHSGTLHLNGYNQTAAYIMTIAPALGEVPAGGAQIITGGGTLTVNQASGTNEYQGVITDGATPTALTKNGTGTLILSGANTSYSGPTTISAGELTLAGAGRLGGGVYSANITNNAVFNCAGSAWQTLSGIISGTGTVTKSGAGTLALRGVNTFTGPLTISGGTVEIQASPATGSAVWLDAAMISSMAKNSDGTGGTPAQGDGVGRWTSLSGSNWVSSTSKPTYQTNVLNGLPVLRFAGGIPFMSNVVAQGSTVFIVYKQTGNLNNYLNPLDSQGQTPTSGWLHLLNNSNLRCLTKGGGQVSVGSTFPSTNWAVQAVQLQTNDYRLWINESAYGPSTATNQFTAFTHLGIPGDFAEVLIYTNLLSASDRTTTISYLQKKWLGVSGTSAVTNSLSPVLTAEIKAGAVLDLCGGSQTLAALAGSGHVTNGTVTVTGRLTPGDTSAAAGVLTVGGNLILAAGATNAFDYVAGVSDTVSVAGTLTLQGANVVELSLNGQPPPEQMTLFTFNTLVGEGFLTTWSVQGAGLKPYSTRVKRVGNSVVLNVFRNGTLISVR
jgi:autotransporter-associated beta strand protein